MGPVPAETRPERRPLLPGVPLQQEPLSCFLLQCWRGPISACFLGPLFVFAPVVTHEALQGAPQAKQPCFSCLSLTWLGGRFALGPRPHTAMPPRRKNFRQVNGHLSGQAKCAQFQSTLAENSRKHIHMELPCECSHVQSGIMQQKLHSGYYGACVVGSCSRLHLPLKRSNTC